MDFLRRIEDDVRNLGVESRRKHPEVREAAERALLTLRTMRESYVSEVMHGKGGADDAGRAPPRIAKFRSAEVSAPYVLACGSAAAEMPIKLVKLALNGIQILLNYEVVPPSEAGNILRVLLVQSHSSSADVQLKVLQIVLQLANALAADTYANQYLTVGNVREMLQLSLQLCVARSANSATASSSGGFGSSYYSSIMGGPAPSALPPGAANIAVASTAVATVRQILALIMDATVDSMAPSCAAGVTKDGTQTVPASAAAAGSGGFKNAQLPVCAEMFLKDLSLFVRRKAGQWLVGVTFDFGSALDLLHEILGGWPELFVQHQNFRTLFQHTLCGAVLPLLLSLPVDYVEAYKYQLQLANGGSINDSMNGSSNGGGSGKSPGSYIAGKDGSPAATVTKIARIARCILLQFPHEGDFLATAESVASVALQSLHPDRENDLLLKTLPGNILDGTVSGGGTVMMDGSVSHSLVVLTESVADHADQAAPISGQNPPILTHNNSGNISSTGISNTGSGIGNTPSSGSSIGGSGGLQQGSSSTAPSLISRLTSTSKLSQHTKEQIAYFSRTTSGGIVLPLSTACNYSYIPISGLRPGSAAPSDGVLALTAATVPNYTFLASHPAGVCLEALLAFLITEDDLCVRLTVNDTGEASLVTVLTSVILSVTSTLTEALMIDANIRDFEIITKNSHIIPLVENILSQNNGNSWDDFQQPRDLAGDGVRFNTAKAKQSRLGSLKSLRDHLFSHGGSLTSGDVLLLGFLSLQLVSRHLVKSALLVSDVKKPASAGTGAGKAAKTSRAEHSASFFPASADGAVVSSPLHPPPPRPATDNSPNNDAEDSANVLRRLHRATIATFERTGDKLSEACTALLCRCNGEHFENSMNVTRRALNILAEAALACGLLGLQRQGDVLISTLCRFTVPRWQQDMFLSVPGGAGGGGSAGGESLTQAGNRDSLGRGIDLAGDRDGTATGAGASGGGAGATGGGRVFAVLKRRHIQSFVRLTQVVHVLADAINDWDTIMDCFEQMAQFLIARHRFLQGQTQAGGGGYGNVQGGSDVSDQQDASGLSMNDTEKIFQCIERFKGFTVFMSDETIVKLMTSLVALSVNSLSTTPSNVNDSLQGQDTEANDNSSGNSSSNSNNSNNNNNNNSTSTSTGNSNESSENNPISISMRNFLKRNITGSEYMLESLGSAHLNYSLHMAIEIVKINAFRVSCIWQMATSHLRILASHKMARTRVVAVAATNDIITTTLEYMRNPSVDHSYTKRVVLLAPVTASKSSSEGGSGGRYQSNSSSSSAAQAVMLTAATWADYFAFFFANITDTTLYEDILPPYQTSFMGRTFQEHSLKAKSKASNGANSSSGGAGGGTGAGTGAGTNRRPQLTQADLLSSLRGLANIKFADVRKDVMLGLLEMLEGGGQAVTGGWGIIIELLTAVPASMLPEDRGSSSSSLSSTLSPGAAGESSGAEVSAYAQPLPVPWPVPALLTAFSCITLIVDDFLDTLKSEDSSSLTDLVTCLSMFSRQSYDVNISLTSVQMLWKVTDFVMTASREQGDEHTTNAVLNVMLEQLLELSLDLRPEIRNCATNTLFSAIVSNAVMLSSAQWLKAFQDIIFPLFLRTETRSSEAMRSKEQALAPEIKKGVKMAVHHSRDTAHKQWSETRIFALRGLSRVIKICLRTLLVEDWFQDTWVRALDLCVGAVQSDSLSVQSGWGGQPDLEVSLAGVDAIFDMLKMVSSSGSYKAKTRAAQGMRVVGGALVADTTATTTTPISNSSSTSTSAINSSASTDIELLAAREQAQQMLWQLAWSAVKVASCFTSSGWDLPLHLCKHLRELYAGGTEAEFRYSQNIQSLLEVVVVLARPRVLVEVKEQVRVSTGDGGCVLTVVEQEGATDAGSRIGSMTSGQLHRSIMDMLKSVHPKDTVAFSCLVTCIAELCFHGEFHAQMPNIDLNHCHAPLGTTATATAAAVNSPAVDDVASTDGAAGGASASNRRVVFAPVHPSLREEVENYLLAVLQGAPDLPAASDLTGACANPAKANKVVIVEPFFVPFQPTSNPRNNVWFTTALHILSREFVAANCLPASMSRIESMFPDTGHSVARSHLVPQPLESGMQVLAGGNKDCVEGGGSGHKRGSFLVSLAKMMSLSIEYDDDEGDSDVAIVSDRDHDDHDVIVPNNANTMNIRKDNCGTGGNGGVSGGSKKSSILRLMKLNVRRAPPAVARKTVIKAGGGGDDNDDNDDDDDGAGGDDTGGGVPHDVVDGSWDRFHLSASSLRLMAAVLTAGLPALRASGTPSAQAQTTLRNCLFIAACCTSPWSHDRELRLTLNHPSRETSGPSGNASLTLNTRPSSNDVLVESNQTVDGVGKSSGALAEHVSGLLGALASHVQALRAGASSGAADINAEMLMIAQTWIQVLVHSSQLTCLALVDAHNHTTSSQSLANKSAKSSDDTDASVIEQTASFLYFVTMLTEAHKHLFALLAPSEELSATDVLLQTKALSGAYQVLASLVDLSTPKDFSDQDGSRRDGSDRVIMSQRTVFLPSPMIREVCASYLRSFCALSTSAEILPMCAMPGAPVSMQVALGRWVQDVRGLIGPSFEMLPLTSMQLTMLAKVAPASNHHSQVHLHGNNSDNGSDRCSSSSSHSRSTGHGGSASGGGNHARQDHRSEDNATSTAAQNDLPSSPTQQDDSAQLLRDTGHLFLLSEMSSRLMYSKDANLRAAALHTLRAVDTAALVVAYKASVRKIKLLEAKNLRLLTELSDIKSAASFQF